MANTERHGFFSRKGPKSREEVRSSLRVVEGGRAHEPSWLDSRDLKEDRFLRDHFLDRNYSFGIVPDDDPDFPTDDCA